LLSDFSGRGAHKNFAQGIHIAATLSEVFQR